MPRTRTIKKVSEIEDSPPLNFVPELTDPESPAGTTGGHEIVPSPQLSDGSPIPGSTAISQPASLQSATLQGPSFQCDDQAMPHTNDHVVDRGGDIAGAVGVSAFVHGVASAALHSAKRYKLGIHEFLFLGALIKSPPQTLISLKTVLVGDACAPSRAFKNLESCALAKKGPATRGERGRFTVVPTRKGRAVFVQLEKRIAVGLEHDLRERGSGIRNSQLVESLCGLHELIWATPSNQARDD